MCHELCSHLHSADPVLWLLRKWVGWGASCGDMLTDYQLIMVAALQGSGVKEKVGWGWGG